MFGHPKGLFYLFFTEMWERFSYYGMRALFTLYLISSVAKGGLGWEKGDALDLYGTYTMMVYVMSILGGVLADKVFGQKKAVVIGGLLLCAGHGIMAIEAMWAFYTALCLIVLGVGFLKPNISTMVGGLYKAGDANRDKGFTLFYIGINLGAFLGALIVGWVGETIGWHYGFGLAGIGMLLGQLVFMSGQKHLEGIGELIIEDPKENSLDSGFIPPTSSDILFGTVFLATSIYLFYTIGLLYGILALVVSLAFVFGNPLYRTLDNIEQDRVKVLLMSFGIVFMFWGAFEQAGGLMNIYTQEKTARDFFGMGVIPASVFQSLNAGFIILFGTLVANIWAKRKKLGKESSTLFKMAIGNIVMAIGFVMMVGAALESESTGSSAMYWLVFAYLFHTIGELCASPTALSFITKLAPARFGSLMMGIYFAATGLGNKLAGELGKAAGDAGELEVFLGIAIFSTLFGFLVISFLKKLKALTHGVEDEETFEKKSVSEQSVEEELV